MAEELVPDPARRQEIRDELERLEESAMFSSQAQFEQAKHWRRVNYFLGIPATALAAAAGGAELATATNHFVAGIMALLAAGLGAVLTTVNASHHMNQATSAANAYLEIQTASRQYRLIDLPSADVADARQQLAELTSRRDEQNKTAEPPGPRAVKKARANITSGGQSYEVDNRRVI
ncbi:MAG: SLATT domain-containing protein [Acidimicrobiaceae bacterium]|nr:SLATT domain-containing protein [Acidimicrobiaceae bacterium]